MSELCADEMASGRCGAIDGLNPKLCNLRISKKYIQDDELAMACSRLEEHNKVSDGLLATNDSQD